MLLSFNYGFQIIYERSLQRLNPAIISHARPRHLSLQIALQLRGLHQFLQACRDPMRVLPSVHASLIVLHLLRYLDHRRQIHTVLPIELNVVRVEVGSQRAFSQILLFVIFPAQLYDLCDTRVQCTEIFYVVFFLGTDVLSVVEALVGILEYRLHHEAHVVHSIKGVSVIPGFDDFRGSGFDPTVLELQVRDLDILLFKKMLVFRNFGQHDADESPQIRITTTRCCVCLVG